jgi:hypothetical protein
MPQWPPSSVSSTSFDTAPGMNSSTVMPTIAVRSIGARVDLHLARHDA